MKNIKTFPGPHLAPGRHWSRLRVSLLWIYRGALPAGVSGIRDPFPTLTGWLILRGHAGVTFGGGREVARKGEWLFPKPVPRMQFFSPDARILSVRFRIEWPNGEQLFEEGLGIVLKARDHPDLERAARRLERMTESLTQKRFSDASFADEFIDFLQFSNLEKAVHTWAATVYRVFLQRGLKPNLQRAEDPRTDTLIKGLDDWPLDEPYRGAVLARSAGLCPGTLERLALRALGTSSKAYMDRRRLDHALQSLRNPDVPVKQIAIETGFRHASSFCAWFKSKTGVYPGEMAGRIF